MPHSQQLCRSSGSPPPSWLLLTPHLLTRLPSRFAPPAADEEAVELASSFMAAKAKASLVPQPQTAKA